MDKFIEDLMVLDAVALEKQHTRGAGVSSLIPIDAATIRLRVDETGALPEPPETAFVQVIRGQITAEMTADEMIYEMMNPRNDSPYGLSPIESLVIIITSSLKAGTYNLAYLTDTNVPEGLFTMPEGWQPQAIQDFQDYFDALMAGNESETRRMKFMPDGKYVPTKKPTDMAFEQFNDWLMKITCALFEVTPIEIGFNPKTGLGGVGFSEVQGDVAEKKGIMPMAKFIEEIFTKIIQEDLGFPDLQFTYTGLIEHDEKSVAELNAILINSGQRTVNELRTDDGLDPIDGLDKPFVTGQVTFLDQESQDASANAKANLQSQLQDTTTETVQEKDKPQGKTTETDASAGKATKRDSESSHVELVSELRTFRKYALARSKAGKSIRAFESEVLPESTVTELNDRVQKSADQEEIKSVFKEYMDDYQINFLADVDRLRKQVAEVI
jgi:HK97 family phage portal protein